MLVRVVKMTFRAEAVEAFKTFFDETKDEIRGFEGCTHLELWQDTINTNIFFTYSHWHNENALAHYRSSTFFKNTWSKTRQLFAEKAEAWSVNQIIMLK